VTLLSDREYLLICLAEEAAELAQAATKAIRFDHDNTKLNEEYADIVAIAEALDLVRPSVEEKRKKLVKIKFFKEIEDAKNN